MDSKLELLGVVALFAMIGAPLHAGNLVVNPGFETGDRTGWTFSPAASGSYFGIALPGTYANSGGFEADFGGMTVGDYDTISQVLPTVAGDMYSFSFWLAADMGVDDGQQVLWNGNVILNLTNFAQPYTLYTFTETASSSSTAIAFAGYNRPAWTSLDDVSASAIPEPSTVLLLGIGSAALLAIRRRHCRV